MDPKHTRPKAINLRDELRYVKIVYKTNVLHHGGRGKPCVQR